MNSTEKELEILTRGLIQSDSVYRQLQQQQQAELDRGGSGEGLYEAGPITLSQVSRSSLLSFIPEISQIESS